MTALCSGGGPSSAQPNAPAKAAFTIAAVDVLLTELGVPWLIPFITAYSTKFLDTATFCATDPPVVPSFNFTELNALLNPFFNTGDSTTAYAKLDQLISHSVWPQLCQCNAGPQPVLPVPITPKPVPFPGYFDGNVGFCIGTQQSQCRVLNLWNGATNNAEPANWFATDFDDSAWPLSSDPVFPGGFNPPFFHNTHLLYPNNCPPFPGSAGLPRLDCSQWIAPWTTPASGHERFLVRWRFTLPSFSPGTICATGSAFTDQNTGTEWFTGLYSANGNTSHIGGLGGTFLSPLIELQAGPNLVALSISNNSILDTVNYWGGHGGISLQLAITGTPNAPNAPGCCPPDPSLIAKLEAVLSGVSLIQRQLLPFAYITGASHPGLTNQGTLVVQGDIGVQVVLTVIPGRIGQQLDEPTFLFDVGWVSIQTADGLMDERRITRASQVWLPRLMSDATLIGFSFTAGVTATITELVREP